MGEIADPRRCKTLSVSPCEGEDLVPEVGTNPGPCVSPLHRGEQEGSCNAKSASVKGPQLVTDPSDCGSPRSATAATDASSTCATSSRPCSPGRKNGSTGAPPGRSARGPEGGPGLGRGRGVRSCFLVYFANGRSRRKIASEVSRRGSYAISLKLSRPPLHGQILRTPALIFTPRCIKPKGRPDREHGEPTEKGSPCF